MRYYSLGVTLTLGGELIEVELGAALAHDDAHLAVGQEAVAAGELGDRPSIQRLELIARAGGEPLERARCGLLLRSQAELGGGLGGRSHGQGVGPWRRVHGRARARGGARQGGTRRSAENTPRNDPTGVPLTT